MGIVIGIDVGGSTTKIAGFYSREEIISTLQVKATDPMTSVYGALGRFINMNHLELEDVERIILTGVGASVFEGNLYNIPTEKVDEFRAIGLGGLELSGKPEALVVSMGTGTAYIRVSRTEIKHIGGSGVGGGTLVGLCSRLAGANHFESIMDMAEGGNLDNVDLMIEDISKVQVGSFPPHTTASNFGKMRDSASTADVTLGVINMVFQTIGTLAVFACKNDTIQDIVLTGSLTTVPQVQEIFESLSELYGVNFIIPENAIYATATGAALSYLEQ